MPVLQFSVKFLVNKGCKREDGISDLQERDCIFLNGGVYVNSMRVYMKGKFAGLIVVTKKYDESKINYYHQAYGYHKGLWDKMHIQANTLEASQKAFRFR